jgi:hypothetical protein
MSNFGVPQYNLNSTYAADDRSQLVRSTWTWLDVARGLSSGVSTVKKFGRNYGVTSTYSPLCIGGVYPTPQTGSTLRIKAGGDANDTAAGSGARQITIEGLDDSFNLISETIATAGASESFATTAIFTRLFRFYVSESGTYATASSGSHSGDIVIEDSAGVGDWGTIDSVDFPKSQSEVGAYSVPLSKTAFVKLRSLTIDSGKTVNVGLFARSGIDQVSPPYDAMRTQSVVSGVSGGSIETFGSVDVPFGPYSGGTDIGFMAKVSSGTASVSVEFEVFLLDD